MMIFLSTLIFSRTANTSVVAVESSLIVGLLSNRIDGSFQVA